MKSVLEKYNEFLQEGKGIFSHLRVTIREDEEYGDGIVELENGTPSGVWYDKETGKWN